MKSKESVVRVTLDIDRDRLDRVTALANVKGLSAKEQIALFLALRLNHPKAGKK